MSDYKIYAYASKLELEKATLLKAVKTGNRSEAKASESRNRYLLVFYVAVAVGFLFVVMLHRRGYQDSWILEGILVPTMIFVFFSLIVETLVSDNRLTAIVAASFSAVLYLIPGLKYQLFYGCYDSVVHYGQAERLISLGHVPETGFYAKYYSDIPNTHLLIGSFSIVTGISVDGVLKFLLPAVYAVIPLVVFLVTDDMFDKTIQKYIIIASSFPVGGFLGYTLTGATFGLMLYFLFIAVFLRRALASNRRAEYGLVLIILAFSLITYHGVTSFFLLFLLIGTLVALKSLKFMGRKFPSRALIYEYIVVSSFFIVLLATWWTFKATVFLGSLAEILKRILATEVPAGPIPARFFEIPLFAQLQVFTVLHLADLVLGTLGLFGAYMLVRRFKRIELTREAKDLYLNLILFLGIISAVLFFQFATHFGGLEYDRFIQYAMILSPFLVGLALWRLDKRLTDAFKNLRIKNLFMSSILFVLFALCLIQVFHFQPLVPAANVMSKDLPKDEYLVDFRAVNTIYQKEMISYVERFSATDARITSDITTMLQIYGFADTSFSSRHIWYSPLEPPDRSIDRSSIKWDLFLLHMSDKAAPFNEKAEHHTPEEINTLRSNENVIYDNGESFVMASRERD